MAPLLYKCGISSSKSIRSLVWVGGG
jgi:hypothetical protein